MMILFACTTGIAWFVCFIGILGEIPPRPHTILVLSYSFLHAESSTPTRYWIEESANEKGNAPLIHIQTQSFPLMALVCVRFCSPSSIHEQQRGVRRGGTRRVCPRQLTPMEDCQGPNPSRPKKPSMQLLISSLGWEFPRNTLIFQ